jgi:hypothetical protein
LVLLFFVNIALKANALNIITLLYYLLKVHEVIE